MQSEYKTITDAFLLFRNTNLTDANFSQATLKSTDLRSAILTHTCFLRHKSLRKRQSKVGSYLTHAETINQLPNSPQSDKPGIKELLTQLQVAIEEETDLNNEDKAEALEQVKALAKAGKNPQEGAM